jgi:uncharacterized protein YuzE
MTHHQNIINIPTKNPPVVETDSDALAAYIRFSKNPVKETKVVTEDTCIVTIDLDANGEIVGVELVGVKEFTIRPLLKMAGLTVPEPMLDRATYVPARLQAA